MSNDYFQLLAPKRTKRWPWALLGVAAVISAIVLIWWVKSSPNYVFVLEEDGVWRPRVSDEPLSEPGTGENTRVLPEREESMAGEFEFLVTQSDGSSPVTFDPCQVIAVELNLRKAPQNGRALTERALDAVEDASGLKFEIVGETDRDVDFEATLGPDDPVLVSWTDSRHVPELKGAPVGIAGGQPARRGDWMWFVSGQVALDSNDLTRMHSDHVTAVIMHELGHLLGLDHVDSIEELMYPEMTDRTEFGGGDRSGLAALGAGRCAAA